MSSVIRKVFSKWYIYALAIALSVTATEYWCDYVVRPTNEETISLFLGTYSNDVGSIREKLKKVTPSYLLETNITNVAPNDSDFGYYFVNKGLNTADIFVLPESILTDEMLAKQFASLDDSYVSTYFNYSKETTGHGILIHEKDATDSGVLTFKNEDEEDMNYYLFFRVNSIHIGKMNSSDYDTALLFAKVLLGYE